MVTTRSAAQARSRPGTPAAQQPAPSATRNPPAKPTASGLDPASRARTIAHMNKDHADDMSAILQHHAHLSASQAAGPEMLDLDLTAMTIRSASGVHTVALTPPMDTWDDRRARLVSMTADARTALGLAAADRPSHGPPVPPRYVPPQGADWISLVGVTFYFLCAGLVYGALVTPGSPVWRAVEAAHFPRGPVGFIWLVQALFLPVLGIHLAEAWWMDRSRLAPAGVPRGSKVWWLWVVDTFLEGAFAYWRWDRVVKAKGAKAN